MKTPIRDFINKYVDNRPIRLHMPGHKGKLAGFEGDITEVFGADVLSCPTGIIAESEQNAAKIFHAAKTVYSTEGSTLSIKQMLYLAVMHAKQTNRQPLIFAGRNAHNAFIAAACSIGFDFEWITDLSGDLLSQKITPNLLENVIIKSDVKPTAVYVTSPDYLGNTLDISGLKSVCQKNGALLLVDNAHGAYLNFLEDNRHPISLGADMCCDSAHKTLPSLTGGAYLHINSAVYEVIGGYLPQAAALFSSTSPSWLILASLDDVNKYVDGDYKKRLKKTCAAVDDIKNFLIDKGYTLVGDEPLKLTVCPKFYGYTGYELAKTLRENGIEPEFADRDNVVMMFTPENGDSVPQIVKSALDIKKREKITCLPPKMTLPERALSPREAMFGLSEEIAVNEAIGRVFASSAVSCPPAVPIIIGGEVIDESVLQLFDYYGVKTCRVLKNV